MPLTYEQHLTDILAGISEKIRDRRESLGFTRTELAEYSGVTDCTIYAVETGRTRNPGIETLIRLAWALGEREEWIFSDT